MKIHLPQMKEPKKIFKRIQINTIIGNQSDLHWIGLMKQ